MKLTTVSCSCLSADPCQSYLSHIFFSQIENWRETVILLEIILFSFLESLKMLLNGKKYITLFSINNAKMKEKKQQQMTTSFE